MEIIIKFLFFALTLFAHIFPFEYMVSNNAGNHLNFTIIISKVFITISGRKIAKKSRELWE